jgi:hypothetical protein
MLFRTLTVYNYIMSNGRMTKWAGFGSVREVIEFLRRHFPEETEEKQTPWIILRANYTDRETAACRRNKCQFCGQRVSCGQRNGSLWSYSRVSRPEQLLFLSSSSSIVLTRLSVPRSRPTTFHKIW